MHKSINCFSLVVCIAVALQYIDIHVLVWLSVKILILFYIQFINKALHLLIF
jgi:hypothetical protein